MCIISALYHAHICTAGMEFNICTYLLFYPTYTTVRFNHALN